MEYRIIRGIPYSSRLISDSDLNTHQEGEAHGVDALDSVPFQDLSEIGCSELSDLVKIRSRVQQG